MRRYGASIIVGLLVVAIATVLLISYRTSTEMPPPSAVEEPLLFDDLDLTGQTWNRSRQALIEGMKSQPDDRLVHDLVTAWRLERLHGIAQSDEPTRRRHQQDFDLLAGELITTHGVSAYAWIGERLFADFLAVLAPTDSGDTSFDSVDHTTALNALLVGHAWRRAIDALVYVSDFRPVAVAEGLLDENARLIPSQLPLTHLLFRYLWSQRVSEIVGLKETMTESERLALRRWQIEVSRAPLARKLVLIEKLRTTDLRSIYDLERAEAALLVRSGDIVGAKQLLEAALIQAHNRGDTLRVSEIGVYLDSPMLLSAR